MIIVIGGGSLKEMPEVNEYIVSQLQHIREEKLRKPNILFLPQASAESKPYVNSFYKEFGSRLKCKATCALWKNDEMDYEHIREKVDKCDAIYIGGGRFDSLANEFNVMNIRPLLIKAYEEGKLIIGNSAGAMILYETAISDCLKIIDESNDYCLVNGYGLIKKTLCPHSNEIGRIEYIERTCLSNIEKVAEYSILQVD